MDLPNVDGPAVTELTRAVGSLHIAIGGLINLVVGVALGVLSIEGALFDMLIVALSAVVDEVTLVANAQLLLTATVWGGPVISVVLSLVGTAQLYGGWLTYHARHWRYGFGAGLSCVVNPIVFPIGVVAIVLLVLSKSQFAEEQRGPETTDTPTGSSE